jgi:lysophospholipase L1-like esterase
MAHTEQPRHHERGDRPEHQRTGAARGADDPSDPSGDLSGDPSGGAARPRGRAGRMRRAALTGAAALGAALVLTAAAAAPAGACPGPGGPGHGVGAGHRPAPLPGFPGFSRSARHADYVALGDSYTAGPEIPVQSGGACARSSVNYPSLTARSLDARSFTDVSCSGATTDDMFQAQGANPPQLDALSRRTTLVTVGIGGNDIGFSTIIGTCATLSATDPTGHPCETHYTSGGTDQLAATIRQTAPKIRAVLDAVHHRAPLARVVVVGYPDLLPDDGVGCRPAVPFADGDFAYLRDTEKRLNTMLAEQARRDRAEFADTYRPTVGHDMCTAPSVRWIEPLQPASPAAPAHPNATGESVMAHAVLDRLAAHR